MPHSISAQYHSSWTNFGFRSNSRPQQLAGQFDASLHLVRITLEGQPCVRRIVKGRERRWAEQPGTVHFLPADDEKHVFLTDADSHYAFHVFFLPRECLSTSVESDSTRAVSNLRELVLHDDVVLQACLRCLATPASPDDHGMFCHKDEASRRLLVRLARLAGGEVPDWYRDGSVFDCRTMAALQDRIDTDLRVPPALEDLACLVGLSVSHFARKFGQTTGCSLHRFVNARRIQQSLTCLKVRSRCLAALSLDLGFSSQSHFTHVFHQHTGMTPAKYQKLCMASIG